MAGVEAFGGGHQIGLQWGRSVQPLSGPRAVTRSHPNPKSRSYEALVFFSSPACSLLHSFLFQANAPAIKETCIPLCNQPGCSSSFNRISLAFLSLSPGILIGGAAWSWGCNMGAFGVVHWQKELICHWGAAGSRAELCYADLSCAMLSGAELLLCTACSILFSIWQREQIYFAWS